MALCDELLFATAVGVVGETLYNWGSKLVKACVSDGATSTAHEVFAKEEPEVHPSPPPPPAERAASDSSFQGGNERIRIDYQMPVMHLPIGALPEYEPASTLPTILEISPKRSKFIRIKADLKAWNDSDRRSKTAITRRRRESMGPDSKPCLTLSAEKTKARSKGGKKVDSVKGMMKKIKDQQSARISGSRNSRRRFHSPAKMKAPDKLAQE